jgi:hypothetical protein
MHTPPVSEFRFFAPCSPIPAGDGRVHEVKFDGHRVLAHELGSTVPHQDDHGVVGREHAALADSARSSEPVREFVAG